MGQLGVGMIGGGSHLSVRWRGATAQMVQRSWSGSGAYRGMGMAPRVTSEAEPIHYPRWRRERRLYGGPDGSSSQARSGGARSSVAGALAPTRS